jgi:hypothetical protein
MLMTSRYKLGIISAVTFLQLCLPTSHQTSKSFHSTHHLALNCVLFCIKLPQANTNMTTFSPYPAYVLGAACFGRGIIAILSPRSEYGHVGLPLEPQVASASPTNSSTSTVSPLMYFKGIRELSYGAAMMALQQQDQQDALTTFAAILSLVRIGDGLVVWFNGGKELRYKALGHWITGVGFVGWVAWRWSY